MRTWNRPLLALTGAMILLAAAIEMVAIVGQVVRGRASHFDVATPFDSQPLLAPDALTVGAALALVVGAAVVVLVRGPRSVSLVGASAPAVV